MQIISNRYGRIENRGGKRKFVPALERPVSTPLKGDTPTGKGEMCKSALGGARRARRRRLWR